MADESNGESTFEFVEKKVDDMSISGETTKTDSLSSISSNASLLAPAGFSPSHGNLLSNVAPPSALPSFIASSELIAAESNNPREKTTSPTNNSNLDLIKNQPVAQSNISKQPQQDTYYSASFLPAIPSSENPDVPVTDPTQDFNLFAWVKENVTTSKVVKRVAETAKSSVNYMLTTLDPQMEQFMHPYSEVEIIVASDKDVKVNSIRDAFEGVFGKAKVSGVAVNTSNIAAQPVGFAAGIKGAEDRINSARSNPSVSNDVPVIAVENFLLEVSEGQWYDLGVLVLNDPRNDVNLQTFTQMTPVPSHIVASAQAATPADYSHKSTGFAVTIGDLIAENLQVAHNEWHHSLTGVTRRDIIVLAAQSLIGIYMKAAPRFAKPAPSLQIY